MEVGINRLERRDPDQGTADLAGESIDVAEIDSDIALERRIADEVATCGAAAETRTMVNATHTAQNSFATLENVPGNADPRFQINGWLLHKPSEGVRVSRQHYAIERVTGSLNDRADKSGISEEREGQRVLGTTVGIRTGTSCWRAADAEWFIEQRRFGRIVMRG